MPADAGAIGDGGAFRLRPTVRRLFAADALLPDGWARDVMLEWNDAGMLTRVETGIDVSRIDALTDTADTGVPVGFETAAGPVLPGMPNLHSHAFQRAFAGLTEYRAGGADDFWSWRASMYRFAAAITPEQLEAVAIYVYLEMLEAGYTSVCEFHYLHHDVDGRPYPARGMDDATMAMCVMRAAEEVGIGLTLLPVLYQTSGFGGRPALPEQRRFIRSTDAMIGLLAGLKPMCDPRRIRLGLAPHSLRAVPPDSLRQALAGLHSIDASAPIHVHVAEQTAEVDDCLAHHGSRPLQWLLDHADVDRRWCLVHATHLVAGELARAARSGAVAGLCPTTEANLGDGLFDIVGWREAGGAWGIGSDSHVCVDPAEDLMLLEYGQRLTRRRRNVLAGRVGTSGGVGGGGSSPMPAGAGADGGVDAGPALDEHDGRADVATSLWLSAVAGGAQAAARPIAGLSVGQQADFVVLDAAHPLVAGLSAPDMLSAHLFASHRRSAIAEVWTAGRPRVTASRHDLHEPVAAAFVAARAALAGAGR
ncbi:MAG: formimidoylglutamate deiminase [Burkholderiaceae bacterium]